MVIKYLAHKVQHIIIFTPGETKKIMCFQIQKLFFSDIIKIMKHCKF